MECENAILIYNVDFSMITKYECKRCRNAGCRNEAANNRSTNPAKIKCGVCDSVNRTVCGISIFPLFSRTIRVSDGRRMQHDDQGDVSGAAEEILAGEYVDLSRFCFARPVPGARPVDVVTVIQIINVIDVSVEPRVTPFSLSVVTIRMRPVSF